MLSSIQHYKDAVNNFIINDLKNCDYNYYQHNVNLLCYLSDLYKETEDKFDITKDDISILDYINQMLNETKYQVYYYDHVVKAS